MQNIYDLVKSPKYFAEDFMEIYLLRVTVALALNRAEKDYFLLAVQSRHRKNWNRKRVAELRLNPFLSESILPSLSNWEKEQNTKEEVLIVLSFLDCSKSFFLSTSSKETLGFTRSQFVFPTATLQLSTWSRDPGKTPVSSVLFIVVVSALST